MVLRGDFWKRPTTLKPYVLKVRDGFILGSAMDPEKALLVPTACCFGSNKEMFGLSMQP